MGIACESCIQLEITKAKYDNKYMKMECEDQRLQNHGVRSAKKKKQKKTGDIILHL